jgi:hypothetical protein
MKSAKIASRASLVVVALWSTIDRASAAPISGTASIIGSNSAIFDFSGANLTAMSSTVDWTSLVLACNVNAICHTTLTIPAAFDFQAFLNPGSSSGSFNGVTADILGGNLTFAASVFVPDGVRDFTVPVSLQGDIQGYNVNFRAGPPFILGPLLWDLAISGTGTLTMSAFNMSGSPELFRSVEYTFSGDATPIPEPGSILLVAASIAVLSAGGCRKRRRTATR